MNGWNIAIILMFLLVIIALTIGGIALYIALEESKKEVLFTKSAGETKLSTSTTSKTLYTYYTQSLDSTLKKYSGKYKVTVNTPSKIDFTVTDENDNNLTGDVIKGSNNLPTFVNFNSNGVEELKLNYTTSSTDIILYRIEIDFD